MPLNVKLFMLIAGTFAAAAALGADKTPRKKAVTLLASGKIFHHPELASSCITTEECLKVAPSFCSSGKAKFRFCAEQYSGTWTSTCLCE